MYLDQPLQHYLDDLASAQPTPGGGSAAALSGALGAALASMVARLTLGKVEYASVQQEMEKLLQHTEALREYFQQLIQADIDAYAQLSAAFKLPRTTDEERAIRITTIQARLAAAALVPLEVAERAVQLMEGCQRIAEIGNTHVLSDIGMATTLASSAATGAAWMVRVNLQSMKNPGLVSALSERLSSAQEHIAACTQRITTILKERM